MATERGISKMEASPMATKREILKWKCHCMVVVYFQVSLHGGCLFSSVTAWWLSIFKCHCMVVVYFQVSLHGGCLFLSVTAWWLSISIAVGEQLVLPMLVWMPNISCLLWDVGVTDVKQWWQFGYPLCGWELGWGILRWFGHLEHYECRRLGFELQKNGSEAGMGSEQRWLEGFNMGHMYKPCLAWKNWTFSNIWRRWKCCS